MKTVIDKKLFTYSNGALYWNQDAAKNIKAGQRAGTLSRGGYRRIAINGKVYSEHRLIYMMFNGSVPRVIDHINGITDDNRIENLRPATHGKNSYNQTTHKTNTSGVKGVSWNKRDSRWQAKIRVDGINKHIGNFVSLDDASKAIQIARNKLHGEFANHG